MQKRLLCTVLSLSLILGVLTGCGDTAKETSSSESTKEVVTEPVENNEVDESVAEVAEEEPIEDDTDEFVNEEIVEDDIEEVEPEQESEGVDEFEANLSEYLASVDSTTYNFEGHGKYKVCYYADDINEDGFPEVFQYLYNDVTADRRDFRILVYNMKTWWDEDTRRYKYVANIQNNINSDMCIHNMSSEFGRAGFDVSYTKGAENILCRSETCFGSNNKETTHISLSVFRDNEMLTGGTAKMERYQIPNGEWKVSYLVIDASIRGYGDEEHFNNFDSGSTYETTVRFGVDELWSSWQDAVEHLGEMP